MNEEKTVEDLTALVNSNPSVEMACEMRSDKLTKRQIAFVLNYAGDSSEAAEKAGYSHPSSGALLLRNKKICKAIIARDSAMDKLPKDTDPLMDVHQLRQWWTKNIIDNEAPLSVRVKCSDLLAKSYGTFVEKLIIEQNSSHIERRELIINITGGGAMTIPIEHCK